MIPKNNKDPNTQLRVHHTPATKAVTVLVGPTCEKCPHVQYDDDRGTEDLQTIRCGLRPDIFTIGVWYRSKGRPDKFEGSIPDWCPLPIQGIPAPALQDTHRLAKYSRIFNPRIGSKLQSHLWAIREGLSKIADVRETYSESHEQAIVAAIQYVEGINAEDVPTFHTDLTCPKCDASAVAMRTPEPRMVLVYWCENGHVTTRANGMAALHLHTFGE